MTVFLLPMTNKDAFSFQIKQLMQQIVFLENQLSELEEKISSLLHETNQYITTISGIGDVLGAIIVSEIGNINRFERPNQLVAFAGLDVTVKQSGEFLGIKTKYQCVDRLTSAELYGLQLSVLRSVIQFYRSIIYLSEQEVNII